MWPWWACLSVGKISLIARSAARQRLLIILYHPLFQILGRCSHRTVSRLSARDVPGLNEGASEGKWGLGHRSFCYIAPHSAIVHMVDVTGAMKTCEDYHVINEELLKRTLQSWLTTLRL